MFTMQKLEKGDDSAKYLQNLAKSKSGHLHLGYSMYTKYHDPSSNGSPDTTECKSRKRGITMQSKV